MSHGKPDGIADFAGMEGASCQKPYVHRRARCRKAFPVDAVLYMAAIGPRAGWHRRGRSGKAAPPWNRWHDIRRTCAEISDGR
jgi:hypothetical protein